eukprot:PITA_23767
MDVSYDCELNLSIDFEPTSFKEVASHDEWKEAMQKEYDALIKNGTWTLVDPPLGTKPIGCKWVYKNKSTVDASHDKHKVRVVLERFVVKGHKHKVCKLVKSLYGLKQTPQPWYGKLTGHLLKLNFKHYDLDDATLFVKKVGKTVVYLVVYVDDILMTGNNESYIASIKKELRKGFEMIDIGYVYYYLGNNESYIASIKKELRKGFEINDIGYVHYYLGIEVTQHPKYIFLSQKKYIRDLLNKFGMAECNPLTTPMEQNLKLTSIEGKEFEDATRYRKLVGSLNYLTTTRPDISFVVGILSRLMQKPCKEH